MLVDCREGVNPVKNVKYIFISGMLALVLGGCSTAQKAQVEPEMNTQEAGMEVEAPVQDDAMESDMVVDDFMMEDETVDDSAMMEEGGKEEGMME